MTFVRYLIAVAWVVFCVLGFVVWIIGPLAPMPMLLPWWTPFAGAGGLTFVVAVGVVILGGHRE